MVLEKRLKIDKLTDKGQSVVMKFFWLTLISGALNIISTTFIYLHVIDKQGFAVLGTILAISFLVNALTDFPTGVLADWLGHKWVLSFAYVLFSISFFLLAIADTFAQFVASFVVLALANGQASGALQAWFDTNYKISSQLEDPKKEIYREFMGSARMYFRGSSSIFFVIGGVIATILDHGREMVFLIQSIGMLALAFVFAKVLNPIGQTIETTKTSSGYFSLLSRGIKFAFSSKLMTFTIIGSVLLTCSMNLWLTLFIFPIYFGYSGTDIAAASFRWIIWISGAFLGAQIGKFAKSRNEKTWLPFSNAITIFAFFGISTVCVYFIPLNNDVNTWGMVIIYTAFVFGGFFFGVFELLNRKFMLDIIPDDNRNSLYSLLPTLGMIASAPLVYSMGKAIDHISFSQGILIVTIIAMGSVAFQILAMRDYKPLDLIEELPIPYDVYSLSNFGGFIYQVPKSWQIRCGIKAIWEELYQTAMEDGIISENEKAIIDCVMKNLNHYGEAVQKALENGVIDEENEKVLLKLRQKLIGDIEKISMDGDISHDQILLLNKLAGVMNELIIEQVTEEDLKIKRQI